MGSWQSHPASWRQKSCADWLKEAKPTYQELFHHRVSTNQDAPNATRGFIKTKGGLPDDGRLQDWMDRLETQNTLCDLQTNSEALTSNESNLISALLIYTHAVKRESIVGCWSHCNTIVQTKQTPVLHSRGLQPVYSKWKCPLLKNPYRLPASESSHLRTDCHLRGLFRLIDSVRLRSLHLLAGEPLHSASSPRCRWCMLSNVLPLFGPGLEPNALPLQQPPLAATTMGLWNPLWLCPLLTWKGPDAPFLSIIDLALSMAAASLA